MIKWSDAICATLVAVGVFAPAGDERVTVLAVGLVVFVFVRFAERDWLGHL